eukprot:Skav215967  [mRNA]  locus=scaffold498:92051:96003:- [translate_table: standard]
MAFPSPPRVKARTDATLLSVDRVSFEACGGFNAPIAGIFFASEAGELPENVVVCPGNLLQVVRPGDDNSLDLTTRHRELGVGAIVTVAISLVTCARVQFDGFGAVNEVLRDASQPLGEAASNLSFQPLIENRGSIGLFGAVPLLTLMVLKLLATAFSSVSGLVGGTFAPSIYIGACLGGALGRMMEATCDVRIFREHSSLAVRVLLLIGI